MNKKEIRKLKKIMIEGTKYGRKENCKNQIFIKKQKKLIDLFNTLFGEIIKSDDYSKLNLKVFGKIGNKEKNKVLNFIKGKEINNKIIKEMIYFGKNIISILDSVDNKIPNKPISKYINKELETSGVALERFIVYSINKYSKNENIIVEKGKKEFDEKKIDFLTKIFLYKIQKNILIGNQLTITTNKENKIKKINDLFLLKEILDENKKDFSQKNKNLLNTNNYKNENIPDLPILMTINGYIRNYIYSSGNKKNNIFKKAYNNLGNGKDILENLENQKLEEKLKIIGISYPMIIEKIFNDLLNFNLNKNFSQNGIKIAKGEINIKYDSKTKILDVEYFKKLPKNKKEFIYSLKIFITNKFLKKIQETI